MEHKIIIANYYKGPYFFSSSQKKKNLPRATNNDRHNIIQIEQKLRLEKSVHYNITNTVGEGKQTTACYAGLATRSWEGIRE